MVDTGVLPIKAAEHISYLGRGEQFAVEQYFYTEKRAVLNVAAAKLLRDRSQEVELTYKLIEELLQKKKKIRQASSLKINMTKLQKRVPSTLTNKSDIEKYIIEALDYYRKHMQNGDGVEPYEQKQP